VALLHEVLRRVAREHPSRTALVHGDRRQSFAELSDRVDRAAVVVADLVPPGGRIAAIGPNHIGWVELYHGVPAAGRVLAFLNHRLSGAELAALVERSGAGAVVGDPAHLDRLRLAGVEVPMLGWPQWDEQLSAATPAALAALAALAADDATAPDAAAWLLFTSGTTAAPKGAVLTHESILAAVAASTAARPVTPDDVYLFPFPLCHVAGYNVVHRHAHGRPVVLVDGFDPSSFCAAVDAERVISTSLAATMLAALLDHVGAEPAALAQLSTLGSVAYGAAPMPPSLLRRADEVLGVDLAQGYGLTELSGNAVFLDAADHRRGLAGDEDLLRAAGRPAPGVEVRIADEDDRPVPPGTVGEILVRAPQVMARYWDDPEATAAALRGGWLHTGDVGRFDDDGLLHVVDRSKDVIITGGENVSSLEVEEVLLGAPGVARVAVVGVPDPTWGENVCAVVVASAAVGGSDAVDARAFDPDALVATARARLAGFKVPRHVVVVDALPVNAAGKVVKAELRSWLAADPDRLGPRR
jgi:acyl-CoA synthetase (AMP-forming)/AMP-acid ligase II